MFCIWGRTLFQSWHSLAFIIPFSCGGLEFRVTYSRCSAVNIGQVSPIPGFLKLGKLKSWIINSITGVLTQTDCLIILPSSGKIGPVFHKLLGHVNFSLCVSEGLIQRHSEDKFYFIAMHNAHPLWPRIDRWAVVEIIQERLTTMLWVPEKDTNMSALQHLHFFLF